MNMTFKNSKTVLLTAAMAVALPTTASLAQDNNQNQGIDDQPQTVITGERQQQSDENRQSQSQRDSSQRQSSDRQQQGQQASSEDAKKQAQEWFKQAAQANQYEYEAAQYVKQNVQDQQVTQIADRIMQDHKQAQQQLRQQAKQAGVEISENVELDEVFKTRLDALKQKQGEELKRAYVFGQDAAHRMAELQFAWAQENAQSQAVKQYASNALPTLKQHQQALRNLSSQMAGTEAEAQTASARIGGTDANQSGSDFQPSEDPTQRYYEQRAQDLRYQQEMNRLAAERSQNQQIRDYAQRQQQRGEQSQRQLDQEAQQAGVENFRSQDVPLSSAQRSNLDRMRQSSGSEFDRDYVFEQSQTSFRRSLEDQYAGRQGNEALQQSARRSLESGAQQQQDLQRLLILVIDPTQTGQQPGQQGQTGQNPGQSQGQNPGMNDRQNRDTGMGGN